MSNGNERNLDHCLKCSTCHTQCPVVANYPDFPGPKQLGPELERLRLAKGQEKPLEIDESLALCTNCKRCDIACPHGVKPSYYNMKNKARLQGQSISKFRDWILAHNICWGKIGSKIPGLVNFALKFPLTKSVMGLMGIANRDFPKYLKQQIKIRNSKNDKKVLYYPGCYASFNEPEIIQATIDILEAYDFQVELASVNCCGTPVMSNGLLDEAREMAIKNTGVFLKYIREGYKIVTTCSSCGLTLKEEYTNIIPGTNSAELKQNVWDLFELLEEEEILPFNENKEKIKKAYYHVPCHLKAQGIGVPAANLLKKVAVKDLIIEDNYCCGIAGTFGFKKEKYPIAMAIGDPLFKDIKNSQVPFVITDCGTCKLQIMHGTSVPVKHPVVILRDYLKNSDTEKF
ncbi:MAG: glycerol-3-phosphate dehydrogenase subunit [Clostridia bacterium]|jgi:glycerol-3-phosphate dehydrogenase subunit C|nr:glycerol-3-phosphate dehydrogenase subunit [Clostridia bacterium]MDN5322060.1 glycerol-3-phosphate dehydrogenase subunit [Clostridia bacterium]